jgi:hypothetical protein
VKLSSGRRTQYWNRIHVYGRVGGFSDGEDLYDGILIANSIDATCGILPCFATSDGKNFFDISSMELVKANKFYWFTKDTPHTELPFKGKRQSYELCSISFE